MAKATTETAERETVDPTIYLDKPATALQERFATWIKEEVGYNPAGAKTKEDAFQAGVRIATATRMVFQASDFNRRANAESQEANRLAREAAAAEKAAAAKAAPAAAPAPKAAAAPKPAKAAAKKAAPKAAPAAAEEAPAPAPRPTRRPARRTAAAAPVTDEAPF